MPEDFEAGKTTQTAKMFLGSQIEPMLREYLETLETTPEKLTATDHSIMIGKGTVSDDVESMLSRWLDIMLFAPVQQVQSDRKGYDKYIFLDFRNPHVVSEWRSFFMSQYRIATNTKSDDLTAGARRAGSFRTGGGEETKPSKLKVL